jgi:Bacterial Ig-like domain (group 2)
MDRNSKTLRCLCGLSAAVLLLCTMSCGGGGTTSVSLSSIAISPSTADISVGQVQQFQVTGTFSDGSTSDLTDRVTWSSSNSSTVMISASGLATVIGPGSVTITASAQTSSDTASATVTAAYAGMLTYHNDLGRTGQNLNETILTPSNVNSAQFGKLFSYPVDGGTYTQPLYVQSVTVGNQGVHNVVYVATEHDSVYAFDADGKVGTPLWHVSFINPAAGITTVPPPNPDDAFPEGEIGITGTPAIDPASGTLYVVSYTMENGQSVYRLHALDLGTGAEKLSGPVVVTATVFGTGDGTDGQGNVPFDPAWHVQRQALLLLNGVIYVGFASHGDIRPYHGWLLAYSATTLKQAAVFSDTPNGLQGGIWESGSGPAVDANGDIYISTGNGTFDAAAGGLDYGDSVLKLDPSSLAVLDYFTPFNQGTLAAEDFDLGSGGPMLLPDQPGSHPHLLVVAGKEGRIYALDRDNLGGYSAVSDIGAVQELTGQIDLNLSTPAYWQGNIYYIGNHDTLRMFSLTNGTLSSAPIVSSQTAFGYPGPIVSISANGLTSGIAWLVNASNFKSGGPAQLYAYDATDVSHELYDSTQAGSRDTPGAANKFALPTVFNGKVYVGTASELDVYGLLGAATAAVK